MVITIPANKTAIIIIISIIIFFQIIECFMKISKINATETIRKKIPIKISEHNL